LWRRLAFAAIVAAVPHGGAADSYCRLPEERNSKFATATFFPVSNFEFRIFINRQSSIGNP